MIVESVPDDLRDDDEMRTKELFLGCVGRKFEVISTTIVSGEHLLELEVGEVFGEPAFMHSIWIEERHVTVIDPPEQISN
ncbi:hypothetical protein O7A70_08485 [Mesorhizobium sp. Cs1299R1N1]|uniref:hypothetical protein n=1 Tax=Mesorhizobium sp. Cs1299R1N1 TaxID=3015172 RepID=UPI00301CF641